MNRSLALFCSVLLLGSWGCARSELVEIKNDIFSIGFERQTGKLVSMVSRADSREFIDPSAVDGLPWRIENSSYEAVPVDGDCKVSFKKHGRDKLDITWKYEGENPFEVLVSVFLEKDSPMSHWRASFKGLKDYLSGSFRRKGL